MPITDIQKASANQEQWLAARDKSPQVRIVAGPGTGKSFTIEKRVAHLLLNHVNPKHIYVISFSRATCNELSGRIRKFCADNGCGEEAKLISISTMHSLALKILKRAGQLDTYPSTPVVLDDWEQQKVYDVELASTIGCNPSRAEAIRRAYDAAWQTLDPNKIAQAEVTLDEKRMFKAFHAARTNLYSCVLPGELIHKCVKGISLGRLRRTQLPRIDHLIIDEYQDLNACDQKFVSLLLSEDTVLFVAGDDDQSIYAFRHADPSGIVNFRTNYPDSSLHVLRDCFRCSPIILENAMNLITTDTMRIPKDLNALYGEADPPVHGHMFVWSFDDEQDEANAIAESCNALINAGMNGREDEILVLLSNRRVQLNILKNAFHRHGVPYYPPRGTSLVNESKAVRAVYSMLRINKEKADDRKEDYPAYRDLLEVLFGIGNTTIKAIADDCIVNNQNFRELFYLYPLPEWLTNRKLKAIHRVQAIIEEVGTWQMDDLLSDRIQNIEGLLREQVFADDKRIDTHLQGWTKIHELLPEGMLLEELFEYLSYDTEADQEILVGQILKRLGENGRPPIPKRIRMLTIHGAKGLSGKVVFIPSVEQRVLPNSKAIDATGLLTKPRDDIASIS